MEPFILAKTNWKTIKDQKIDLAILPWGATEAHNYHLPFSTDNILVEKIAIESAQLAWNKGAKVVVLPTIPFGVNTGQLDIRLSINMNPSTQFAILNDVTDVLNRQGIDKFLILNGHGGNDFRQIIRELGLRYPKVFICTCNWYKSFDNSEFFENSGGHADEMETSVMQYIAPELTLPLNEAGRGDSKKFRLKAFNEGWAWAERKWTQVTSDTGIGNPEKATVEKGEKCFKLVVETIGNMMFELSEADTKNMYE
jgi:creatinine amidohydrolase